MGATDPKWVGYVGGWCIDRLKPALRGASCELAGLVGDVDIDEVVPGGEELAVDGAGVAARDGVAFALGDGEDADRGAG